MLYKINNINVIVINDCRINIQESIAFLYTNKYHKIKFFKSPI